VKRANVYHRKGRYFVHASSRTTDGVWIVWEPSFSVHEDDGAAQLGLAIVAALDGSQSGVPHPSDWRGVLSPLLALSGVKSWATFRKSATCVEVEEEGVRVGLVPARNLGADGFEATSTDHVFTTRDDPARLGALAMEILRAAQIDPDRG
jgi:hypothetical protein